ncbi:MAG: hypothetical protein AB7D36_04055 [Oscillospiraceae bacterium]
MGEEQKTEMFDIDGACFGNASPDDWKSAQDAPSPLVYRRSGNRSGMTNTPAPVERGGLV